MSRYIDVDKLQRHGNRGGAVYWRDIEAQLTADVRDYATAHKVVGGGERDGTTCWFECSQCHGTVDIDDAYCKHCGAKFVLPFTEEDAYLEAMDIVQECKRGES